VKADPVRGHSLAGAAGTWFDRGRSWSKETVMLQRSCGVKVGLALGVAACLGCASGGQTTVRRAPLLQLDGASGRPLGLRIEQRCTDLREGPSYVLTASGGGKAPVRGPGTDADAAYSGTEKKLQSQRSDCSGSDLESTVVDTVRSTLRGTLVTHGHQVVDGPTGANDLVVKLEIVRRRQVRKEKDLRDEGGSTTCSKLCDAPTCEWTHVEGEVRVAARVDGPPTPDGKAQRVDLALAGEAVDRGQGQEQGFGVATCGEAERKAHLDESRYDWGRAVADLENDARRKLPRLLAAYDEEYRPELLEVKDSAATREGIAAAGAGRWFAACRAFEKAADEVKAMRPDDAESAARVQYDLAVCQLTTGDLDEAKRSARRAMAGEVEAPAKAVRAEIDRRIADRARLGE